MFSYYQLVINLKGVLMTNVKALCLLLVLFIAPAIWSGNITAPLAEKMQDLTTSGSIKAIAMFELQADIPALNQQLKIERATLAERNRRVLEALQEAANATQPQMAPYLQQLKTLGLIKDYKMLWIANMVIVEATREGIQALATRADLADLYLSYPIENIAPVKVKDSEPSLIAGHEIGLTRIHAPEAWALGFTGAGRVVSNIDTGVAGTHPALSARFRGDVDGDGDVDESWYDPYTTHWTQPQDSGSHGTHTMGTICGRAATDTIGVAINAQWIASPAIDRGGGLARTIADAILAFQWIADPDRNPNTQDNPDACGNSWGLPDGFGYPNCDNSFWAAIDNCEAAGTVVVFSAGNESTSGLRSPADRATTLFNCFSVGAVDGGSASLPIASFSARGPSECATGNLAIKPEVVAPGVNVRSSVPGGGYQTMDGTSMSSPHVTGCVAVIRQVNPNLDADAVKEILMSTAQDLPLSNPNGEDNIYGHGIVNLYQACLIAQSGYGYIDGYVRDLQSQPLATAEVAVVGTPRKATANASGYYFLGLPADTSYTLKASFFGHIPDSALISVIVDDTVSHNFSLASAPYGAVSGHVRDLNALPIANAQVRVSGAPITPAASDSTGYYIINNIPGGSSYTILASAPGFGSGSVTLLVPVNDTVTADFSLQILESFEADDGGWAGDGSWEWGEPTSGPNAAYNGVNVWATVLAGNYPDNADDSLVTPYYTIDSNDATFTFYQWFSFENSWDGGNLSISTNNGTTWEILTPDGGYPDDQITGLDGQPGYTSDSGDWVQAIFPVGEYIGRAVKFMFRLGTDGSVVRAGWYLDAVVLNGGTAYGNVQGQLASITPLSISVALDSANTTSVPLTLTSGTQGLLVYGAAAVPDLRRVLPGVTPITPMLKDSPVENVGPKVDTHPTDGGGMVTGFGGPDAFGYVWRDSDEPNGPAFRWVDITSNGQEITGLGDDTNVGPFDIGFDFPYYGETYSQFHFCTNGWISFTEGSSAVYNNGHIPTNGQLPLTAIMAFWDDLYFVNSGTAYYYSTGDSLIVAWVDAPHIGSGGPYTFEMILLASGEIIFQYLDIGSRENECSIGIQNQTGTVGLEVAYNTTYLVPNLAVKFARLPEWLTVNPTGGFLVPSQQGVINVGFNSANMAPGTYTGSVIINTNDPNHASVTVPCTLLVLRTDIADADQAIPNVFSLAQNFPNPFNPITDISFGLPSAGNVLVDIYDIMGRKVKTLVKDYRPAGLYRVVWDSSNDHGDKVASGIYLYKLSSGDKVITKKMVMLK
jgi:subtilisin family serine protease